MHTAAGDKSQNIRIPAFQCPKRVLISGGTTGMGRATARLLALCGSSVFVHGRDPRKLAEALSSIRGEGGKIDGSPADISKPNEVRRVFEEAEASMGGLDAWIDCAAVGWSDAIDAKESVWEETMGTNLLGAICGGKEAAARFKRQGRGNIVLVGSMSAEVKEARSSVYVASKCGIRGLAASLRKELNKDGIGVFLVEPGACDTDMSTALPDERKRLVEKQEMLTAEDVASAILFLLTRRPGCDVITMQIRPSRQFI
ncbi:MAG TPA: SDR family oxidoreductase [Verrucomicrobiales bacterium]|nr:SDR family oxidoreductase [Verrucomicrobiales bacterium]